MALSPARTFCFVFNFMSVGIGAVTADAQSLNQPGQLDRLDNRRLTAAQGYGAEQVKVRIRAGEDVLTTNEVRRLSWKDADGTTYFPRTWAEAIRTRIVKQGPEFNSAFRFGSPEIPRVEHSPRNTLWYQQYNTSPTVRKR